MFDKQEILKSIADREQYIQELILVRPFDKTTEEVMNLIGDKYPILAEDIFEHDSDFILYVVQSGKNYDMYYRDFQNDIGNITPVAIDRIYLDMKIIHHCDYIEPETA
jgi:hypothetical protein